MAKLDINGVNALDGRGFVRLFGELVEHTPWVIERVEKLRPFSGRKNFIGTIALVIKESGGKLQKEILRAHPELSGHSEEEESLTEFSSKEQKRLGLDALPSNEYRHMQEFNAKYGEKFGFPYVVCVGLLKDRQELYSNQESRYGNTLEKELENGIDNVLKIIELRLHSLVHQNN